jgi:hypothetical protein
MDPGNYEGNEVNSPFWPGTEVEPLSKRSAENYATTDTPWSWCDNILISVFHFFWFYLVHHKEKRHLQQGIIETSAMDLLISNEFKSFPGNRQFSHRERHSVYYFNQCRWYCEVMVNNMIHSIKPRQLPVMHWAASNSRNWSHATGVPKVDFWRRENCMQCLNLFRNALSSPDISDCDCVMGLNGFVLWSEMNDTSSRHCPDTRLTRHNQP